MKEPSGDEAQPARCAVHGSDARGTAVAFVVHHTEQFHVAASEWIFHVTS
jgi:hypothetical protein